MTDRAVPRDIHPAVPVLLALCSGIVYGVSDYVGGRASRRSPPAAIALVAELLMLVGFAVVVPAVEADGPTTAALAWGFVAGMMGGAGVLGLYAGLARGNMTVIAPVTGLVASVLPVAVGVALGERPGPITGLGILVAVVAVALIGGVLGLAHQRADAGTVMLAVAVGAAFGMLFVAYSQAGDDAGLWPLLAARLGGTPLLIVATVGQLRAWSGPLRAGEFLLPGIAVGAMIALANSLYLASTREGLLSVVAVIVSLYPVSTVALATVIDHERASRSQVVGMVLAVVSVAAITLGR